MALSLRAAEPTPVAEDYSFKMYTFQVLSVGNLPNNRQFTKMDHGVASNDEYMFTYECNESHEYLPSTVDEMVITLIEPEYLKLFVFINNVCNRQDQRKGILWKYHFITNSWLQVHCTNFPKHLTFNTIILSGNVIIVYGGGGTRFSDKAVYQTFIGNLATEHTEKGVEFVEIPSMHGMPKRGYGQPMVLDGKFLYVVNGMSEYEYEMGVFKLDMETKEWSSLYKAQDAHPRNVHKFKHELAFHNNRLFMFSRAQLDIIDPEFVGPKMFRKLHVFRLDTNEWEYCETLPDLQSPTMDYPDNRVHYGWTQCKINTEYVFMCGGFNDKLFYTDVWRLNLSTFQWRNLVLCQLPKPTFFHSLTITDAGRMYYLDGMIGNCLPGICCNNNRLRENRVIACAWIKIPKLSDMCWDAVLHYFKNKLFRMSKEELVTLGLPYEYCNSIMKAKSHICPRLTL